MEKVRISSLAKELGVKSNLLIEKCHEKGLTHINHHANTLAPEQAEMIRKLFQPATKATPQKEVPKVKEAATTRIVEQKKETKVAPPASPATHVTKVVQPPKIVRIYKGIPQQPHVVKVTPVKTMWKKRHPSGFVPQKRMEDRGEVTESKKTTVKKETKVAMEVPITVKALSSKIGIRANEIITKLLLEHNIRTTINQILSEEVVQLLGVEYGVDIEIRKKEKAEEQDFLNEQISTKAEDMLDRAPIVTFLGHVDHGKTSLLDSIRQTNVAAGEVGGITQHIGAYKVEMNGKHVVFLDTPGHEAFTAMRARGANITDVVVLVVAADDGVMPQTEEALNHAKAANVPIVVALNKIDKPGANPLRVKQQLASLDLSPEDWGGKTQFVETSAITKKGIDTLLERLLLEAEILELKANPKNPARGVVLEARLSEGRGVVANVLIQDGTLHQGDVILCGKTFGRARLITNDRGVELKEAGPTTPVSVSDFSEVPEAGDKFYVVSDIQKAREIALERQKKDRETSLSKYQHVTLESLYSKIAEGKVKEIKVILKADYKGSVEVLKKALEELSTAEIKVKILHCGVGGITESDVLLADASDAIVIGFYVTTEDKARILAEEKGVDVRLYKIIYDATNEIKAAMEGMLEPESKEVVLGQIEIRQVYNISKFGNVAGCYVKTGKITRNSSIRLIRDSIIIYDGKLESLKIVKDDVREVRAGFECGLKIANYDDIKVGDFVEAYEVQKIARTLTV
ncbi:MAG: translation initiation factor IF-2 [Planctomycetes bacterium]|uniref:translation initiation factor IF-2 n=1 Tax=Candidatus Wunengus californicus TaxID=3367619 RepID=UPI004025BF91|nr:translation initiation factor IF-2 [Planctomycetota bacterium]